MYTLQSYLLLVVVCIVSLALVPSAFAISADEEYTPTQTNAYVSYSNTTNEIQVSWNFDSLDPDDDTCLLKGDFWFFTYLNINFDANQSDSDSDITNIYYNTLTRITGFTPLYYSPVTSSPVNIVSGGQTAEVIPCEGSMRIDLDTIMSHDINIDIDGDARPDLQIFLTFYVPDDNGNFNTSNQYRIDEVFVSYTPNDTWSTEFKEYACDSQIGNTLYIDKSGTNGATAIHGNNGDNCDEYFELDDNEYVDIVMDGATAPLLVSNDSPFYGNHDESIFSLLIEVGDEIITLITTNGGSDDHNSRPTFGLDHNTFVQQVDEGLVINDLVYTVTDNYYTPMDMLELKVGATQNFTSTVFAPHTLDTLEFLFGIPEVGKWNEAESSVEIYVNFDGDVTGSLINEYQDSPIINATSLEYSASKVKCNVNDNTEPCYRVSIELSFLESPLGKVLALQAIDNDRKNQILYFNDGLDITGDSLNPPTIQQIMSEIKYKGLQTIQRIDKENDIWMSMDKSEPVLLYQQNNFGSFAPIEYRTFESTPDEIRTIMDRDHPEFSKLLEFEINRALEKFGYLTSYKQIQGDDLTGYVAEQTQFTHTSRADDSVLQQAIKDEGLRAEALLIELLSKTHYASIINNNSHVGILDEFTSDDRPIAEILAEEREMKNILAQERAYLKQVIAPQN